MTYQLLLTLPDPVWESTAQHPAQDGMSLAQWMDIQERHIPCHINQMKRNYQEWLQIPPRSKPVASYWRFEPLDGSIEWLRESVQASRLMSNESTRV